MVLETRGKVLNATSVIGSYVRNLPDLVEHITTGKEEDAEQAQASPEVAALDDRQENGPGFGEKTNDSQTTDNGNRPSDPVDRSFEGRMWAIRQVARNPGMDLFGARLTVDCSISVYMAGRYCRYCRHWGFSSRETDIHTILTCC